MNVIDVDHRPGAVDPSFRPNQIFAVGGLPLVLLPTKRRHRSWKPSRRRFGHRWVCVPWLPVNLATYRAMKVTSGNRDTALPPGDGMAVVNRSVYRSLGSGSWQYA